MLGQLVVFAVLTAGIQARFNKYERLQHAFDVIRANETLLQLWKEHEHKHHIAHTDFNRTERSSSFHCHVGYSQSQVTANSVHALGAQDIKVVAAIGDSLTAGNGILAVSFLDCLTEYRGRAWSIGGDHSLELGVETLPNFLRKFNPDLKGYSVGKCAVDNEGCAQLNIANPGDTSIEMPAQARSLVARLKSRTDIDFDNDWKLITFFIGGNDLCAHCHDPTLYSPQNYISRIREALDILHAEIPRAFVNMVEIFDITPLGAVSQGFICNFITGMVCDCARDSNSYPQLKAASGDYQKETENLVASGRYDTKDDFTVVLQPFFKFTEPPRDQFGHHDLSYFAPDCFHFSERGTYAAAKSLWNNMIEPVGQKQTHWHLADPFHCPHTHGNQHTYFATAKNSMST